MIEHCCLYSALPPTPAGAPQVQRFRHIPSVISTVLCGWQRMFFLALALACAGCMKHEVAAPPVSLLQAIEATPMGNEPTSARFMVEVLEQIGAPTQAQHLRRAVWQWQLARLHGHAPAPMPRTVGEAIAQGATLPAVEAQIAQGWQSAFQVAMRLEFVPVGEVQDPPWVKARPIGSGLWVDAEGGAQRHFALRASLLPVRGGGLPVEGLQVGFGAGADALVLRCTTTPLRSLSGKTAGLMRAHAVSLQCQGEGAARWEGVLPVLVDAARGGGVQPRLTVRAPQVLDAEAERTLWRNWGSTSTVSGRWGNVVKIHSQPGMAQRSWAPSSHTLAPPELLPIPPTQVELARAAVGAAWARVQPVAMVFFITLGVFGIGRTAMPHASTPARFWSSLALCLVLGVPALLAVRNMGWSGDGWSKLATVGAGASVLISVTMGALLATVLHMLHDVLDEEDLTWMQTVTLGWRNALQLAGRASRGEFWGFVVFVLAARAVFVALVPPWQNVLTVVVALPLCTLLLRRLQSLTMQDYAYALIVAIFLVLAMLL